MNTTFRYTLFSAALLLGLSATAGQRPMLHPSSERYRAGSPSAARGRSGSAHLTFRALIDAQGRTEVELSTGDLDTGRAGPGEISLVHLKAFDASGALRSSRNFNHLRSGGLFHLSANDLSRGETLQAQ